MLKSLVIGGVNPVHHWHIALIQTWLENVDSLDFFVGTKEIYRIPYEIRKRALELVLCNEWFSDRVKVIEHKKLAAINTSIYESLVLWSDVLNHFHPSESVHRSQDKDFFRWFNSLTVLQRIGNPVTPETIEFVSKHWKINLHTEKSSVSAKEIRKRYRDGKDFSELLPRYVQELIYPHLHHFDDSTF